MFNKGVKMNSKNIIAFILIILGTGLLLDAFGVMAFGSLFSDWWPVVFIILGISVMSGTKGMNFPGVFFILLGLIFLMSTLDIIDIGFWQLFWPTLIIAIGLKLLIGSRHKGRVHHSSKDGKIKIDTMFSEIKHIVRDDELAPGEVNTMFGSIKLDYSKLNAKADFVELEANAIFGNVKIRIPDNWNVHTKGSPIFGELSNKTVMNAEPETVLRLNFGIIFGSIEVEN